MEAANAKSVLRTVLTCIHLLPSNPKVSYSPSLESPIFWRYTLFCPLAMPSSQGYLDHSAEAKVRLRQCFPCFSLSPSLVHIECADYCEGGPELWR
ncbi:hypothetical protein BJ508DRAFT_165083 [Ascobolus immersus RN42]|uniref:Uncharacterized protein n=1 Tax=Ascobolus immersus RN42 TaxID=1160509 RepID=A0A3N4HVK6_ASCIM|nr:hypothetical protein BJ508DRAFT_165083 [Ascobolus immersus RN42]